MKRYRVVYETRGVQTIDVWVNEKDLPENFDLYDPKKQDEILYDLQLKSEDIWHDQHFGVCVNVMPVRELKAVI